MSFWGGTVITNLIACVPWLLELLCGGFYVSSLLRLFELHFVLSYVCYGFAVIHLYYVHCICSTNHLGFHTNNLNTLLPMIVIKDLFGLSLISLVYTLQLSNGYYIMCSACNSLEVNRLVTPIHIVPEWYFLWLYAMLKAIPSDSIGFVLFISVILCLLLLCEVHSRLVLCRLACYVWCYVLTLCYCNCLLVCVVFCCIILGSLICHDVLCCFSRILLLYIEICIWSFVFLLSMLYSISNPMSLMFLYSLYVTSEMTIWLLPSMSVIGKLLQWNHILRHILISHGRITDHIIPHLSRHTNPYLKPILFYWTHTKHTLN
jgi:quinol-cytochrome oxidoreductase complex cytochrome b subunit